MSEREDEDERLATEGRQSEERDHALTRLDDREVRIRVLEAFDRFVSMGFEVHLVGVKTRKGIDYKIVLTEDGADDIPIRQIQGVADELRLDIFYEKQFGLAMYARW